VLIDRENGRAHLPWIVGTVALLVAVSFWYFASSLGAPAWPGGSSLPGFTFGVVGGLLIVFEMLLWWRKKVRVWRIGRAQAWMRAHIWLGLLCGPLLVYHSGFRLGGPLSAVLLVLLLIVIASGVWGLALQQFLPRRLLDEVPAETIYAEIDHLAAQLLVEADHLIRKTCGPEPGEEAEPLARPDLTGVVPESHVVVGAVRSVGRVQGKVLETRVPASPVPEAEPLREFYRGTVVPFLRQGGRSGSPLRFPGRAAALFRDVKTRVAPAAHAAIDTLDNFCNQRRQWDRQAWIHFWLHSWLCVHLPLSVALVVLMLVHIWVALKYW
jgi:hypothetical protein